MINIDYYIEKAKEMPNISDGGSAAYNFGDVVLVKYSTLAKYGEPREDEEAIALAANEKNAMGVRTPKHLAVKRTTDGKENYCWVLQECAKGNNYTYYSGYSKDDETALERLKIILTAPSTHFEKFIKDIGEIFNLGLELKPKNFFYDEDTLNGGFTIIDLLRSDKTPYDPNSIVDVYRLKQMVGCIYNSLGIYYYSETATPEQKELSDLMNKKLKLRVFQALEKVVPNFEQHRRWILRTYSIEDLTYFSNNGLDVGDLSLTEEEIVLFNEKVQEIISACIKKVASGKNQYWQIRANEIRIDLGNYTLSSAWMYHRDNKIKPEDFEETYDYQYTCNHELERIVNEEFDRQLEALVVDTDNPYLLQAKEALDNKKRGPKY